METDVVLFLLAILVRKFVDFVRYAVHGDVNGVVTQLIAWIIGIITVYMAIWANWDGVAGDVWPRILWGVYLGSLGSTLHDLFQALAKTWSTRPLIDPRPINIRPDV